MKHLSPRQYRALALLLKGPVSTSKLRLGAGALNPGQIIMELRRDFDLRIVCNRSRVFDRDGQLCFPGVYSLLREDIELADRLLRGESPAETAATVSKGLNQEQTIGECTFRVEGGQ